MSRHLSPSLVISLVALFVALGGTSYAVSQLPKNSVGTKQLKKNAVTSSRVKNNSLLAEDFKAGQLPQGAPGPQGVPGPQGEPGPASGPAGGALAGNYPNPVLAAGSVGAAQLGSQPTAFIRFTGSRFISNNNNDQSFPNGFSTVFDNANMARDSGGALYAPRDGLYQVSAQIAWSVAGVYDGQRRLMVKNSAAATNYYLGDVSVGSLLGLNQQTSGIIKLNADDHIYMTAAQDSTDNSIGIGNLSSNGGGTFMTMTYIGPAN